MAGTGGVASNKALAPATIPPAIDASLHEHRMDQSGPLGPGRPLQPSFGYSTRPRSTDYPTSVNISTRNRSQWGRVPFETLRAVIGAYDVARMCINHKIDEIRSMELMFQPADRVDDDVEDAIDAAKAVLAYPDRELPYESWFSKWMEGAQKFDAAPLYRRRDYNGDIIGLEVVDGTTVYPYIDENGRRPAAPAPAWNQIVHGTVAGWFTTEDLIYVPFRPQDDSPFGLAPIESILLTANTDVRFQWHFLQMFTDGNVPAGFMEVPPDISDPDQVAEWQDYYDATVTGDQAKLHQIIAVPHDSKFTQTRPAAFDPKFPEWLMKRTCAAYGVVPQDLGLVSDVNRANGETQVDIQFRVNTLPWVRYVEGILTRYIQHDIGLPVKVALDTGRDKEDRLQEAQAHQIYVEMGAESPDEVRVDILGKTVDKERPTPRFYSTPRLGPIPLLSIGAVAGSIDPDTYGPAKDQKALDQPYVPPIGVVPAPGTTDEKASLAAVDAEQVAARRQLQAEQGGSPTRESGTERDARGAQREQRDAQAADDSPTQQEPDEQEQALAKSVLSGAEASELSAFREFVVGSRRRGKWRNFAFHTLPAPIAAELNRGGRAEVVAVVKARSGGASGGRTDTGPVAAGIAVQARDTGRVLMLQRGIGEDDPAAGTWEFPGGCLDDGELPQDAAKREWQEEVGCLLPEGEQTGSWASSNGVYAGFVWTIPAEDAIRIDDPRDRVINPDDPARDHVEAIAWWDPAHLAASNPALRRELAGDTGRVKRVLAAPVAKADVPGWEGSVGPSPSEYTKPHVYARDTGSGAGNCVCGMDPRDGVHVQLAPGVDNPDADPVAKAGEPDPKAQPPEQGAESAQQWPGWQYDLAATAYWAPLIAAALGGAIDADTAVHAFLATHTRSGAPDGESDEDREQRLSAAATEWLEQYRGAIQRELRTVLPGVVTDGYAIGAASGVALVDAAEAGSAATDLAADMAGWAPGNYEAAMVLISRDGTGAGLRDLLDQAQVTIKSIADSRLNELGFRLAVGATRGDSADTIAGDIRDLLTAPWRAHMIASTELARAVSAAAVDGYARRGYRETEWLTAEDQHVCPEICGLNEDAGPRRIGVPFPSGALAPPGHPECRCAPGVVISSREAEGSV
jgi:8-oxo-dGTP pyrophosphatase MutT (NUDIX family)